MVVDVLAVLAAILGNLLLAAKHGEYLSSLGCVKREGRAQRSTRLRNSEVGIDIYHCGATWRPGRSPAALGHHPVPMDKASGGWVVPSAAQHDEKNGAHLRATQHVLHVAPCTPTTHNASAPTLFPVSLYLVRG